MIATILAWIAVFVLLIASTGLILSRDWRWDIGFLALQYVGVFWLVTQHWPIGMAAVKLVTGWMATATLGMTLNAVALPKGKVESLWPQGRAFRIFMVGMVAVLAASAAPRIEAAMPGIGQPVIAGAILLTGTGLLHLGIESQIERVIIGLLTVMAGFEILYAAVEGSILVAGLLSIVNLGLGLVGAYLLNASTSEEGTA
jgi:hypothetical protein